MITKADITLVKSLADKRARDEHGLFVVEGRKMVAEAVASPLEVVRVFGTEQHAGIESIEIASTKDIERMSSLRTPQGVLAVVRIPERSLPEQLKGSLVLALENIQDPGNLGTIIRTADWFGVRDVVCSPGSADCFNPKAVQATMGAVLRVRVHYLDPLELAHMASSQGVAVYGTFLEGEDIYKADLGTNPDGVVFLGNEGNGISAEVEKVVQRKLFIPPYPVGGRSSSESLNVSAAAAIICSEFRRR